MWYSIFHDGNSLQGDPGDVGPIPGANFANLILGMFCNDYTKEGVFTAGTSYGGFALTGAASPLSLSSGIGLCFGRLVVSTEATPIVVASPSVSSRNDRLVLRFSDSGKTVRSALLTGVEGAGGYPALTQTYATWEVPLWKWTITTGGVITLTDERYPVEPRIQVTAGMHEIVEKTIFVPAGSVFDVSNSTQIGGDMTFGFLCEDAHQVDCRSFCICPPDLAGGPRIQAVVYSPSAAGDIYTALNWYGGKLGQALNAHQGGTGNQVWTIAQSVYDSGGYLDVGLADTEPGQIWMLHWLRQGDQGDDTLEDNCYFVGFQITYQAYA